MQLRKFIGIVMLSGISAIGVDAAHAQGLTRAQVQQQLIEAQHNGLEYVADASYPDVSRVYQYRVQQMRADDGGFGPQTGSSAESGAAAMPAHGKSASHDDCVGPASFCNVYFGS
ncbi:MAG TPA: DUF4148 domain-containing protein [Paraburkholderia sp.]|jgi:hypothetical protein